MPQVETILPEHNLLGFYQERNSVLENLTLGILAYYMGERKHPNPAPILSYLVVGMKDWEQW